MNDIENALKAGGIAALIAALVTVFSKIADIWAERHQASDKRFERTAEITQDDKDRLWKRVEQLESAASASDERHERQLAALRDRHDRELIDVRTRLDTVTKQLNEAQKAVELTEAERQHAMGLYTALLQAHERLKVAHDELKLQVSALQAENAEMRRRLPPGPERPD